MSPAPLKCIRHPDVETRLRCSSCEKPICPDCWRDAVIGFHCIDCSEQRQSQAQNASGRTRQAAGQRSGSAGSSPDGRLPNQVGLRATGVGLAASITGGLLLGPVLLGGTFFLLSAGVIGWLVARAVVWAADERATPYVKAMALTLAGFTVVVGLMTAGPSAGPLGILFLAYPAALYGGWIVVRQR